MKRIFVAAIIAICALAPSVGSADHIPDNVSQKRKSLYASAGWTFNEPDGSFLRFGVAVTDANIIAGPLRDRIFGVCVNIGEGEGGDPRDSGDDTYRSIRGCRPLQKRQLNTTPNLEMASFVGQVPTEECKSSVGNLDVCSVGPVLNLNLVWTAADPLIAGSGTDTFGACIDHRVVRFRHHKVNGFVNGAGVEYTRNQEGTGFIIDEMVIRRVRPEGGDCE